METAVIVAIIGAIEAVGVAVIGGMLSRSDKAREDSDQAHIAREQQRMERDTCLYDLMFATAEGTEVLLHSAHGEKMNGNVDEALESIKKAKAECNRVFNRQAAML